MAKFRLDQYIRYFLSGAIVFPTLFLSYPQTVNLLITDSKLNFAAVATVLSFLIGILMYSIHRAILYRKLIELCIFKKVHNLKGIGREQISVKKEDVEYKHITSVRLIIE